MHVPSDYFTMVEAREVVESIHKMAGPMSELDHLIVWLYEALDEARRELKDHREAYERLVVCSTCGGIPHTSGKTCICDGTGTVYAEVRGLHDYVFTLETRLALARLTPPGGA